MLPPYRDSPTRAPDWRWERARWLLESGRYARRVGEDPVVLLCKRYQARHNKTTTDVGMELLRQSFPGLFQAHEIRCNTKLNTRWLLEAWLLSGESIANIHKRTCVEPDVIRWYERCFFNVLDRIEARDYICNVVIGASIHHGVAERDYDVLWKIFAYGGGPPVLDAVTTTLGNKMATAWFHDDTRDTVARKAAISARTMPVAFNQAAFFDIHTRLRELETIDGAGGGMNATVLENVRHMLDSAGQLFVVGSTAVDSPQLLSYDKRAAELRSSEVLTVVTGQPTAEIDSAVSWKFPEGGTDAQADHQGN